MSATFTKFKLVTGRAKATEVTKVPQPDITKWRLSKLA